MELKSSKSVCAMMVLSLLLIFIKGAWILPEHLRLFVKKSMIFHYQALLLLLLCTNISVSVFQTLKIN